MPLAIPGLAEPLLTRGGIALSGHVDTVPVDGQAWAADPFALRRPALGVLRIVIDSTAG